MTIRMRALSRYRHRGVLVMPGEPFTVDTEEEARELVAVGFGARADVAALEQPPTEPEDVPPRGRYARRDVRAKP